MDVLVSKVEVPFTGSTDLHTLVEYATAGVYLCSMGTLVSNKVVSGEMKRKTPLKEYRRGGIQW